MNSSGIKRGLAATAVGALAVTGLPFLASSASAAPGDELQFVGAGPTRDSVAAGAPGGYVVLKAKGVADQADAQARIKAIGTDLTSSPNNANQSVQVNTAGILFAADGPTNMFGGTDGYAEIYVPVKVDTATTGATANYALFLDDDDSVAPAGGDGVVQSTEARVQVQQATSGAPATVEVAPVTQTAPVDVDSGDYTLTVKDAAGRTTQLIGGEDFDLSASGGSGAVTFSDNELDVTDFAQRGIATFKAQADNTGLYTLNIKGDAVDGPAVNATAQLDVVSAASGITQAEVDVVTGADTREGFGNGTGTVTVRPDQANVRLDINSPSNAGRTVSVTASSANVTFGGAASKTYTTTLDSTGKGSITVAVDASSIASGDSFTVTGSGINISATYAAPAITPAGITADAANYLSAFGGTVNPTITITDQYGNPITGVYVTVDRVGGANGADAESARVAVDAQGKATFALTDTSTGAPKAADSLTVRVYPGLLGAALETKTNVATITYSQDGTGADFNLTVDGQFPAGSAYDPNSVFANPLTDTNANNAGDSTDESIALALVGGTNGAPVTVSVDGGALVLKNGETRLAQGAASKSGVVGTDSFRIIGTESGLVTVTVTSGGRTKTAQVSIRSAAQDNINAPGTARNIDVTGPESGEAGEVVTFTATVTDAFGNPVRGVAASSIQTIVTGGGQVIGNSGVSNSAGEITFQVQIADSADGDVTLRVTGSGAQFGAAENRLAAADTTDTGAGLSASEATATATVSAVNIEDLEQAVEDAQAKVDAAQDVVDAAKDDRAVAQAERKVAQKAVKAAKKDLKQAKKQKKGVKAAQAALRAAKGDLTVAKAKVKSANAKVKRANQRLAAAQAELEAAEQALEDAQSDN